eukprot:scaffold141756_cov27-Prasinocladus_malaysianus.AAC.1
MAGLKCILGDFAVESGDPGHIADRESHADRERIRTSASAVEPWTCSSQCATMRTPRKLSRSSWPT